MLRRLQTAPRALLVLLAVLMLGSAATTCVSAPAFAKDGDNSGKGGGDDGGDDDGGDDDGGDDDGGDDDGGDDDGGDDDSGDDDGGDDDSGDDDGGDDSGGGGSGSSGRDSGTPHRLDHDDARSAVMTGRLLPIEEILETARGVQRGTILSVDLRESGKGRPIYDIMIVADQGTRWRVFVDGRSGNLVNKRRQ